MTRLLDVQELHVSVDAPELGWRPAVNGLSLSVSHGEAVGIVGESGCGKTLTTLAILGLLPEPHVRMTGGRVVFNGEELTSDTQGRFRALRGRRIGYIPQNPMSALNPVLTVGDQVKEAVKLHCSGDLSEIEARAVELMYQVGVPAPTERMSAYPHQLSGGQRQRILIAIALAGDPDLIIADEPTTALDVTVQAQVLRLLKTLQTDRAMGLLLVTHDLAVVSQMCDRTFVLYAGQCVESGPTDGIFSTPLHPYTRGLLASLPSVAGRGKRLHAITGQVPGVGRWPSGCRFRDRCPRAEGVCGREEPEIVDFGLYRFSACHFSGSAHE